MADNGKNPASKATFDLQDYVEVLTYDFTAVVSIEEFPSAQGIIPEPSSAQIQNFRKAVAEMFESLIPDTETDMEKMEQLRNALIEVLSKDRTEVQQKTLHAIADLCSNHPTYDVLEVLPYRHQQAFIGWISGIFLYPQLPTPATKA